MKKYLTLALIICLCLALGLPAVHAEGEEEGKDEAKPQLLVADVRLQPRRPEPGEAFTVYFTLENIGQLAAHDVVVSLDGMGNYTVLDVSNRQILKSPISGGDESSEIKYTLRPRDNREGNQVRLTLSYFYQGTREEQTEVITLPLDRETGTSPRLEITDFTTKKGTGDQGFLVSFTLANRGDREAQNIKLTLDGGNSLFPRNAPSVQYLEPLDGGRKRTLEFPLILTRTDATVYPLTISIEYSDLSGERYTLEQTFGISSADIGDVGRTPQLMVSNILSSPQEPAPGEAFTVYFFLENLGRIDAENVVVTLDGLKNFTVLDTSSKKVLRAPIPGGRVSNPISYTLQAREEREGNQVELTLAYTYHGTQEKEQVERVTLPLDREAGASPRLEFTDIYTSQSTPGREFLLSFTLVNRGDKAAQNIKLTLDGGNNILPLNSPSVRYLEPLAGGESRTLSLALGLNRADTTVYPLTLTLEYSDRSGQKFTAEQTLGLSSADIGATGSTPRVIISKYTLTPEQVFGGSLVTLALEIENTNLKPVHNVKISLGVVRLENERGDTVFSPVNSSNSFYLDYIPGKNVVTKEIDLFVDPNAGARTYIVPVTIEYEDDSGNPLTVEEMVTIPVTQESRMEVITVDIPPQAFAGQPVPIGAEFVNVGKVALDNFMVALEGDFPKENASYYVGRLEPGMSDYFQGLAFPAGDGILEGRIVFSYIDGSNQEVRREEPFSIPVMAMMEDPAMVDGEFPPDMNGPGTGMGTGLSTGQSLLLLALMAVGAFIYKRRLNAREKEKELFYE